MRPKPRWNNYGYFVYLTFQTKPRNTEERRPYVKKAQDSRVTTDGVSIGD
jgi:hypothetical protein